MNRKQKNNNFNYELWLPIIFSFLVLLFWNFPIVYPIKLFVVLLHEISHAIIAVITGGTPIKISLNGDLSGLTIIKDGNPLLIASAGYLGSLFWGLLLFLSAKKNKFRNIITLLLSAIILISSVNLIQGGIQTFFSLLAAFILFAIPRFVNELVIVLSLRFIGITSLFYVIADIKQDLLTITLRETDTQIIEYYTGIPAIYIGFLWLIISITLLYLSIRLESRNST